MPNVNIYLPDELAEGIAAQKERLNVSAVCQRALREELAVLKSTEDTEFERIELDTEDSFTNIIRTVRFMGRWLVEPDRLETVGVDGGVWGIALTQRGRVAVWRHIDDSGHPRFGEIHDYNSLEVAERTTSDMGSSEFGGEAIPATVLADARAILTGTVSVMDLDI